MNFLPSNVSFFSWMCPFPVNRRSCPIVTGDPVYYTVFPFSLILFLTLPHWCTCCVCSDLCFTNVLLFFLVVFVSRSFIRHLLAFWV
ncbi:hypothetical protein BC829DRAFT_381053 [Chytridium lagenaria]|nr:hypothetical protein BC829DRAFT_381053 [Chytridium lagenaria]